MGDFWLYTIGEINILLEAYNERKQREAKEQIAFMYELADAIASRIGRMFSKEVEPITPEMAHPDLFEITDEERKLENARKQAESRHAFANRYNSYLRKKYGRTQDTSIDTDAV